MRFYLPQVKTHKLPANHKKAAMTHSILQRVAGGEFVAVRECIEEYGALVWSLARRLTRSTADAEDATQEIFLQVWRCAARFDSFQGSETTFVATLARRHLVDRLRKARSNRPINKCNAALESLTGSASRDAPDTCFEADRNVLQLGLVQGYSHSEIADRLGMPMATVKACMRRGLLRVRESLHVSIGAVGGRKDLIRPQE